MEGGALRRPTNVPRSPRLAELASPRFLLLRTERDDVRQTISDCPARCPYQSTDHFSLITSPLTDEDAESVESSGLGYPSVSV
jgi:hypothetical protein